MGQVTRPQAKMVVILIVLAGLILLLAGLGYYFYFLKGKLPLAYTVTVDLNKAVKLTPRPILRKERRNPGLNFYFRDEAIDVGRYRRVKVLNPAKVSLRLLEVLDEDGLVISVGRRRIGPRRNRDIRYKELHLLEEIPGTQATPGYLIEVEKLEKGKRYVLCEWDPSQPHLLKYFFAFTR